MRSMINCDTFFLLICHLNYSYFLILSDEVAGLVLIDPLVETLFDNNSTWSQYW